MQRHLISINALFLHHFMMDCMYSVQHIMSHITNLLSPATDSRPTSLPWQSSVPNPASYADHAHLPGLL